MGLLIAVGYISSKRGMVNQVSVKDFGNMLVNWVIPCVVINAFQIEYSDERAVGLIWAFGMSCAAHIVLIVLSAFMWRGKKYMVERLATIYTNGGFMGIPLVMAVFGAEGVFYASVFSSVLQLFFWSHGVAVIEGGISMKNVRSIMISPATISFVIGIVIFFFRVPIPSPISLTIKYIMEMNSALAMFVAGMLIANTAMGDALRSIKLYLVSFTKLVVAPIAVAVVLKFVPMDILLKQVIVLQMSCPMAVVVGVAMTQRNMDSSSASKYFVATTILCMVTIPVVYGITGYIL